MSAIGITARRRVRIRARQGDLQDVSSRPVRDVGAGIGVGPNREGFDEGVHDRGHRAAGNRLVQHPVQHRELVPVADRIGRCRHARPGECTRQPRRDARELGAPCDVAPGVGALGEQQRQRLTGFVPEADRGQAKAVDVSEGQRTSGGRFVQQPFDRQTKWRDHEAAQTRGGVSPYRGEDGFTAIVDDLDRRYEVLAQL